MCVCWLIDNTLVARCQLTFTFVDQLFDRLLRAGALLLPPAVEERRLHVDEPPVRILQQLIHHRVQDVLHPRMLDVITVCTHTHTVTDAHNK